MRRARRMGLCPCKQPGRQNSKFIGPISLPPSGKCLAGRSAALRRLPIARAIGSAPRLAFHPGKVLVRLQKDFEQALRPKTPALHRKMHLHVFGRSPRATHPDWLWGEPPRFPNFAQSEAWTQQFTRLEDDEGAALGARIQVLLDTRYALSRVG